MKYENLLLIVYTIFAASGATAIAAPPVESNVIYGMYSGTALLMDVHKPDKPNGYGVIFISGSGWHASEDYGATDLKSANPLVRLLGAPLVAAGYTVFSLNHRAAPRFRYPAAVEDVQRAVRFVRHNARRFGVRVDRIGAVGGSSGGHLVSLLGVLNGAGDPQDPDPVNRRSAKVQVVIAVKAPADLFGLPATPTEVSFLGIPPARNPDAPTARAATTNNIYRQASPVHSVTKDSAPFLLIHGDADRSVDFAHSERMEKALQAVGVEVKLIRIPGGTHAPDFGNPLNAPDYHGEMVRWFDRLLKANP